jgi:hypothetical protein
MTVQHPRSWRKLVHSAGWGNAGVYVNQFFQVYGNDDMACEEPILPQRWYHFGISRSSSGEVRLYLNGYRSATARTHCPSA